MTSNLLACVCVCVWPVGRDEALGLEKGGFVQGGIFVLKLHGVPQWAQAVTEPLDTSEAGKPQRRGKNPFASVSIKAEFKGYGGWRVRTEASSTIQLILSLILSQLTVMMPCLIN